MIIIVEGIDRVGKTTLANKLDTELGIDVLKMDRAGGNNSSTYDSAYKNFIRMMTLVEFWNWNGFDQDIVIDRFHWTEAVYSKVDRNNDKPLELMKVVENSMLLHRNKYVIVQVQPTDIERSSSEHGSDLSEHEALFDKLYEQSDLQKIRCKYGSIDKVVKKIDSYLAEEIARCL